MNNLKQKLKNGESVIGTFVTVFDNPDIAKMLKVCGFDFFVIDSEHGYMDYSKVAGLIGMANAIGIPPIVRIPEIRREVILKYLEMGAAGLLVPNVQTPRQAEALVYYSKYYPMGNRGVALLRAHTGYEKLANPSEYMKKANEETILIVQIESPTGVENVDHILDVKGIDAAFIGPSDLTQSMGIMGQTNNPLFIASVDKVINAAKERGKYSGIYSASTQDLQKWMDKGMTLNIWSSDVLMLMSSGYEGVKQLKKDTQYKY